MKMGVEEENGFIMSSDLGEKISRIRHVAYRSITMIWKAVSFKQRDDRLQRGKYMVFEGNMENFKENGALVLEESISLFNGKTNPISYLSVDELNSMNIEPHTMSFKELDVKWYKGLWDGKCVLVKEQSEKYSSELRSATFREILVAAQMSTHRNVHKLLGCCLETKYVVLVYEYVENVTLHDLVFKDNPSLDWKQRLKIAWEISHAMAYLHIGLHRPIIHRSLKPQNVYLGMDNSAKLSDFSLSISVPEDKEHLEDIVVGTWGYLAPEYISFGKVTQSIDVYAFGVFFLVLLTGKDVCSLVGENNDGPMHLHAWVANGLEYKCISEIVDSKITGARLITNEEFKQQLRASIGLALRCTVVEFSTRPTMVEVSTELMSIIKAYEYVP